MTTGTRGAVGGLEAREAVEPGPPAKATRRQFTAAYKLAALKVGLHQLLHQPRSCPPSAQAGVKSARRPLQEQAQAIGRSPVERGP